MNERKQKTSNSRVLTIPWHQSMIVRTALAFATVLLLSYIVSIVAGIQSIGFISKLVYKEEVEKSLTDHGGQIKLYRNLQETVIKERIESYTSKESNKSFTTKQINSFIGNAVTKLDIDVKKIRIDKLSSTPLEEHIKDGIAWKDHQLRVYNYALTFPKGKLYEDFMKADQIKGRYQLVGTNLENNIRPNLIKANSILLLLSFIFLFIIFYFVARKFKENVKQVIQGFGAWSSEDPTFRFRENLPGELGLISRQFNLMANEVEVNRQRSMHLEKIASWQVIARKLAHEIKNPLTPIQMMVSQLGRRYKGEDPEFKTLLEDAQSIITEEVSGLRRMVDNFSDFARLPSPTFEKVDIVKSSHQIIELQKAAYPKHELVLNSSKEALCEVDESLLKQVFKNLTKNAAEACTDPAKISINIEDAGEDYIIQIEDNGPGIPEQIRKRIFEAYFTTKHTGPSPGMGLGLAICQKIILDHKGTIDVKSRPGCTIFEIKIPKTQEGS